MAMEWGWFKTLTLGDDGTLKNSLNTMFKVFAFVTPCIKVSLYPWFGLGVLGCTIENLEFWVKERLR